MNLRRPAGAIALAALVTGATAARADILATTSTPERSSGGSSRASVVLNIDGGTALKFKTTVAKQKVVITFNAECRADGAGWVTVLLLVDGKATNPPSGVDFALCTAGAGWVGAVRQSVYTVPTQGTHSVTVLAQGISGNDSWSLADISLVVVK